MTFTPEQIKQRVIDARKAVRSLEDAAAAEEIAAAKGGRPTLAEGEPTEQITVRVPSSLRMALTKRATETHATVSTITREALEHHLAA